MIDSITRITLNLQETNTMVSIRAKRGDTGRKLLIHLSDGSIPYHIGDDCYATFTAKKPDGTKINNACTIENNVIEYEFTDQTCTAVGTMKAEIRLYGADDKMITSACFLVNVYDTVFRDGDEVGSETEMNTLDDLILRANAFLNETGKLLRWQGNWDSETEYEANDLVLHEDVLYVAEEAIAAGTAPGSEEVTAWVPIAGMGTGSGGEVVGIASVKQTTTTSTSGGLNVVTVTLTDGTESEIKIRNGYPGASIQGPQGPMGLMGPMGPVGPQGPAGPAGDDYVLTDSDKAEIAEMAADLVEVPEGSGGSVDYVVQDTPPEDTSVLWVDPTDNSDDGFRMAVNAALAQAKASGEFDGAPGQPGKDGKDYVLTPDDKTEIAELASELVEVPEGGGIAVTGATVGQTVKISAVDENGVPTAWESVDFPSGGGGEPVLLASITTEEDLTRLTLPTWEPTRHVQIVCSFNGSSANTAENSVNVDIKFKNSKNWSAPQQPYASRIKNTQASIIDIECSANDINGVFQNYVRYAYGSNSTGSFIKHASVETTGRAECISFNISSGVIGAGTTIEVYKLG